MTLRVATDVGGTFTDLVAFETHPDGRTTIRTAKSDTTPPNFEQGVLAVLEKGGVDPADIDFLAHGTTVVINALTERKGVKVGLITTTGFRDTLEIARATGRISSTCSMKSRNPLCRAICAAKSPAG